MSNMIPAIVAHVLDEKANEGFTGKVTLNFKDGVILAWDITESFRLQRETDPSRASSIAGGSGGTHP